MLLLTSLGEPVCGAQRRGSSSAPHFRHSPRSCGRFSGIGSSQDAAAGELLTLRQGRQSVMDFAVDFRVVASRASHRRLPEWVGRSHSAPVDCLPEARHIGRRDQPRHQGEPATTEPSALHLVQLYFCSSRLPRGSSSTNPATNSGPKASCIHRARAQTHAAGQLHSQPRRAGTSSFSLCLYCGGNREFHLILPGKRGGFVLIDSGADANIISRQAARQLGLRREPLPRVILVRALDGHQLGTVSCQTGPADMLLADTHLEQTRFHRPEQSAPGCEVPLVPAPQTPY